MPYLSDLFQNLMMVGSPYAIDGPVWTLFVEMRISLIFPFLFFITKKFNPLVISTASVLLSVIFSRMVHFDMPEFLISLAEMSRFLCLFVFGAVLALPDNLVSRTYQGISFRVKIYAILLAFLCIIYRYIPMDIPAKNYIPWIGVTIVFVLCLYSKFSELILNRSSLIFLGRISFGLYLVHFPILQIVNVYVPGTWSLLIVFPLSILLGWILNVIIEEPMIRIGRKLSPPIAICKINNNRLYF